MSHALRGKKILIVDDEDDLREILKDEFEMAGCVVTEANGGKVAFEVLQRSKIDVVVSDVRMPSGSGIELLENIKKSYQDEIPVILLTGFADITREEAIEKGAAEMFGKPFDLEAVKRAVEKCLV